MPAAQLLSAYLIVGADQLKRESAVKRLIKRLGDNADFNLDQRTLAADDDPSDLVASLNQLPFASDFRLVIIQNGDHVPKPCADAIVDYLKNPSPTTVLAVVAEKLAKNTRLYKALAKCGKQAVVDCTPKKRYELPAQVRAMATAHGKTITPDAAEALVNRVGESTVMLDAQLKTLAALMGTRDPITLADVEAHVARTAEVKPWELVDAVCERNMTEALRLLALMGSGSPVAVHSFLVARIRELICAKSLAARGASSQLAQELGFPPALNWRVKNHARWARNYTMDELVRGLVSAAACERTLKGTGDSATALLIWLCDFMRTNEPQPVAS